MTSQSTSLLGTHQPFSKFLNFNSRIQRCQNSIPTSMDGKQRKRKKKKSVYLDGSHLIQIAITLKACFCGCHRVYGHSKLSSILDGVTNFLINLKSCCRIYIIVLHLLWVRLNYSDPENTGKSQKYSICQGQRK